MNGFPSLKNFLFDQGIIGKGKEAIDMAKKEYKKLYQRHYKREQRKKHKQFFPSFSAEELRFLEKYAIRYKRPATQLIHDATLAYLKTHYLIPDEDQLHQLELSLAQSYEVLRRIEQNHRYPEFFQNLKAIIEQLEATLVRHLTNPVILEQAIVQALKNDSSFRLRLPELMYSHTYDHQESFSEK